MITSACGTGTEARCDRIHHESALALKCRESAEAVVAREASPCFVGRPSHIDSQSVKSAEKGINSIGWLFGLASGFSASAAFSRCRQADQGQERAACSGSIRKACCSARHRHRRRRSGSPATAVERSWLLAKPCDEGLFALCSSGNCSPTAPVERSPRGRDEPVFGTRAPAWPASCPISSDRDRQAIRSGEGLRRIQPRRCPVVEAHPSPGCQPLPPTGQGTEENLSPPQTRIAFSSPQLASIRLMPPENSDTPSAFRWHKVSGRTLSAI